MMIADWLSSNNQVRMIVEWFGFMPNYIAPLLSDPRQAIWVFPNDDFKQQSITKRDKPNFHRDTFNPELAWQNHLGRDLALAEMARQQAQKYGLKTIINDGKLSPQQIVEQVEAHFRPLL
ncbi:MAG: hypothetical protein AAFV93_02580 [Chloroflexota bacterium]